jgi:hypothetical protein
VWLRAYLAEHGPVISTQVIDDASAADISCSTLRKARLSLNVRLERVPGVGARHLWSAAWNLVRPQAITGVFKLDDAFEAALIQARQAGSPRQT